MSKFLKRVSATVLLFIVLQLNTRAQGTNNPINKITIASPTAASLGKYGDIPVNYHTGIPQISIPIYTISAGPLSLPISLSYHASGLKVQEPASWVGAGWALNAGGVITRTVVGAPDERGANNAGTSEKGHFSDYGYNSYNNNNDPIDWTKFANGTKDGEPDLFFFNFGNYSGKFYFRDDRTPVIVPEADFKIEPYYNPDGTSAGNSIQAFTITTPDAVKYYFGNTPGLTGTPPIEITNPITPNNGLSTATAISSWYLNKITTADGQFSITLNYLSETYGYHTISMFPISDVPSQGASSFESNHGYGLVKNIVNGVRLNQIIFPNGSVNFVEYASARTDLSSNSNAIFEDVTNQSAKPLGSIQISDGTTTLKKFNFTYGYFADNTTALAQDVQNFAPNLQTDRQRLKLDQVQEISGDGTVTKPPHYFSYFSEQVPRRLSFGIDHWGFANAANANQGLIPTYTKYGTNLTTNVPGADRDPNWPAMRGGTLQQINYPTGGYSLFEFEPNSVYNTTNNNVNVTLTGLTVHLYGQSALTNSSSFTSNGTAMNIAFNSSANYSTTFTITNSSNTVVYNMSIGNGQSSSINPLTLPQGNYTATLSLPNTTVIGGCTATVTQWQTVTTNNTITIGGNRIKTITHNDGVTANNIVTNYDYNGDNGLSSAVLYSRPVYVGIIRNDLIQNIGYYKPDTGFVQYPSLYGCLTYGFDASCYKSPSSLRPMASTQGYHIGYAQVKTYQTNNGYSKYKYYGSTGTPVWQANSGDVVVRTVNAQGCDANAPNFPSAPLPFDYLRGELQYEAHYNQAGQILKEATYIPTFVSSPVKTPAFSVTGCSWGAGTNVLLGTYYELSTAKKTQTQVTETVYDPATAGTLTTTSSTYYESPYHPEITRTTATNSKGEVIETKKKYAFDFRLSTCDAIADGYTQYNTDCTTCLNAYNTTRVSCGNNNAACLSNAYFTYLTCKANARINYVNYRRTNFTDVVNNFKTYHDNAKAAADAELKPILQLQDNFENSPIETSKWKNGNLLGATFSRFDYSTMPAGKVYLNKVQAINLAATSPTFTNAATSAGNSTLVKDSRYLDETFVKFYNGNLGEITSKDGVTTSYLWGYNNTLPVAKAIGTDQTTLLNAYSAVGGNLSSLRSQFPANTVQLNTYTYAPVIGMVTETDVNGKSISYEYDKLQRLLLVRDFNNNILKQYDYKYQVMPAVGTAQWIATGNTRCKPCPQNSSYITNILQQEEKDNNPASGSYNTLRWNDIGISTSCVSNADWQNTATPVRCKQTKFTFQNTGEQEQEQMDMNPCSSTYGQLQWIIIGVNYTICPLPVGCNSGNCTGADKKCISNICETGVKVYTSSVKNKFNIWTCTYHYQWSDGSISADYTETTSGPCF